MIASLRATCRLQVNAGFDLRAVREIVPYLAALGVSHVYLSPVLRARRGSTHGYDVVDPAELNPELGTDDDWRALVRTLRDHDMGIVLDIVPNHMGTGAENPYWEEVLTLGRASRYAKWFDIDWEPPHRDFRGRVMVPVLGDYLETVIERGEISLVREGERVRVKYFESSFPLSPESSRDLPADLDAFTRGPGGRYRLRKLLAAQHYRLAFWRRAEREINYRRFFDINELIGLRQEDATVFDETHARILAWVGDGEVDALRIDHIDGLLDPRGYLERLREGVGKDIPIVVEKILSPGENLRRDWPVEGTTGYEFMNDLEGIFIHADGYERIERAYRSILGVGDRVFDFHHIALSGKLRVVTHALASDVLRLTRLLEAALDPGSGTHPAVDRRDLIAALVELIASFPVYRTYIDERTGVASETDRAIVDVAMQRAVQRREAPPAALSVLGALLRHGAGGARDDDDRARRMHIIGRFQQTTGPAAAKGVEDTALYRFVPLVSRNEVGADPERDLRDAVPTLHAANHLRAQRWPRAFTATNTHDTKRSADVRARLDVLSEIPEEWEARVRAWRHCHAAFRTKLGRRWVPDANTEYLTYETLVGIWPLCDGDDTLDELRERADQYLLKASREAKTHTGWTEPDEPIEQAIKSFVGSLLQAESSCVTQMREFARRIARPGLWNALARIAVHLTAPGTPDIYQGDELWSFSLVDPDNRRPVDWARRARLSETLSREWSDLSADAAARRHWLGELLERAEDGRVKLHATMRALSLRRERRHLFAEGSYEALLAAGPAAHHVFAFARRANGESSLTVVPRLPLTLTGDSRPPAGAQIWRDTYLPLPPALAGTSWQCALGGHTVDPVRVSGVVALPLGAVLDTLPIAVLVSP